MTRIALAAACALTLAAAHYLAVARFANAATALLPGSRFPARFAGGGVPERVAIAGSGSVDGGTYVVPSSARPGNATLVAANGTSIAVRTFRILSPPRAPVLAVASYDDGIAFHDTRTFAPRGTLATSGAPSDVVAMGGIVVATDTDGAAATVVRLAPWSVRRVPGVLLGDELAADPRIHAIFVTERELNGKGGLARISPSGVRSVVTGTTAEGIAIDLRRQRVYVADVNDNAVTVVSATSMRVIGRIPHIPRAFSLALSHDARRLYVVSNQSESAFFGSPGRVTAVDVDAGATRVVTRSASLSFPLGIALGSNDRLFITDEQTNVVDVLDARTLRPIHPPIATCRTPWKPAYDAVTHRLYVPCAGSNEVDVVDTRTLHRVRGAPFRTGSYPLAVSVVRP